MTVALIIDIHHSYKHSKMKSTTWNLVDKLEKHNGELTQSVSNLLKNNRNFSVVLAAQCQAIYDIRKQATKNNALSLIYDLDNAVRLQQERLAALTAKETDASD